jgi:uncharacterized delta-60 repeat protein
MKRLLLVAIPILVSISVYSQAGTLDPGFNGTGKVFTSFYYDYGFGPEFFGLDQIKALAVQSDGKIVAGGYSYNGIQQDFALARYNTDGSLDNTFGQGGQLHTNFVSLPWLFNQMVKSWQQEQVMMVLRPRWILRLSGIMQMGVSIIHLGIME